MDIYSCQTVFTGNQFRFIFIGSCIKCQHCQLCVLWQNSNAYTLCISKNAQYKDQLQPVILTTYFRDTLDVFDFV